MTITNWLTFWRSIVRRFDAVGQMLDEQKAMLCELLQGQAKIMSALDDLTAAVDNASTEMAHAVTTIQNHPNPDIANDPRLSALADRLNTASTALKAVDPADAVTEAASQDGGATTNQPAG